MPSRKRLVASCLSPLAFLLALAPPGGAQGSLLITSRFTDEVLRYDATSGAFLGVFAFDGGLDNPVGLTFGPDGHLYVVSAETDEVLRYHGTSGVFLGVFASGGGLDAPRQLAFGPDGALYVASGATNAVLRFDGATGAFRDVFASGNGINGPTSFAFGPDGDLFVGSVLNDRIKRFDGASGAFLGNFVSTRIDGPHDLAFGPDGFLYVSNAFDARILRFDGASGVFHDVFVQDAALSAALGLSWDEEGALLVVNQGRDEVRRYDGGSGAFLGLAVAPGTGGVSAPLFACLEPRPDLRVHAPLPGLAGIENVAVVSGGTPGALLWLALGDRSALWRVPGCTTPLGMPASLLHFVRVADESGRAFVRELVPPSFAGRRLFARALEPARCRISPLERVRF